MANTERLNSDQILSFLSGYKNAIALYTTENIILQYANKAMLAFWGRDESIFGFPLDVGVPEIQGQPFMDMLRKVYRTGIDDIGEGIRADLMADGVLQTFYFDYAYRAIKNEAGETVAILHTAEDVTERVLNRESLQKAEEIAEALEWEQALNEELAAANEELNDARASLNQLNNQLEERVARRTLELEESVAQTRSIVENAPFPIGIYIGRELRIAFANSSIIEVWGKGQDVVGKLYTDILPELINQEVFTELDSVFITGKAFHKRNQRLDLVVNGEVVTSYFNYSFTPLLNTEGNIYGVMNTAADVTDAVTARMAVEEASDALAAANEELAATNEEQQAMNEEMVAINEELASTNEELMETQHSLSLLNGQLVKTESRFRRLVQHAPVAIFVLHGPTMIFETVNDLMYRMLGKTSDIIGKTYAEAVPELVGQPFFDLLDRVYTTGETFYGNEIKGTLDVDGQPTDGYFNFIYHAIRDEHDQVTGIMCVAIDVIDQVKTRKIIERAEESLRLAVEAADMGTYSINTRNFDFYASPRLKELFGFGADENMPYEACMEQIHPDYRAAAYAMVEAAVYKGERFEMEYKVLGRNGSPERWLRGTGTLQQDSDSGDSFFTGVIFDITERREDEQRKNDFIGMVSHELKTPLTSLYSYLQVLQLKAKKSDDQFTSGALDQSVKQVKKMTVMINGFLNVSRLESGKIHIERQLFDMAELVKDIEVETLAMNGAHHFVFHPVVQTIVNADRDKISQVISNLISNAVKYSKTGSTIQVACITKGNEAFFSVSDEGIGIRPDDITRLFERYYRVEGVKHVSGFGIGLYLSAEIIKRHEGKIWAESEAGKGSTFYFSLPVSGV